jgi:hypothetical protein
MAEYWSCIECEDLFDDTDGDTDKRMCNKCINMIKKQKRYGISDIVISNAIKLPKYIDIHDKFGKIVDNVEIYFIEEERINNAKTNSKKSYKNYD